MPVDHIAFFLDEIDALQAEESLRLLNIMRVSQAGKDNSEARILIRTWENQARRLGRVEEPEEAKPSRAEYFAMLGRMGLNKA